MSLSVPDDTFATVLRQRNVARDTLNYTIAQRDQATQFARAVLMAWMEDLKERHQLEREVLRLQKKCGKRATVECSQSDTLDPLADLGVR